MGPLRVVLQWAQSDDMTLSDRTVLVLKESQLAQELQATKLPTGRKHEVSIPCGQAMCKNMLLFC